LVQVCVTVIPAALQLMAVLVAVLHAMGPGVHMPAHPLLTTQVEFMHACGCPGWPFAPHTTSELPVQVLLPGTHPQKPPPVVGSQAWPVAHRVHDAPDAPQLVADSSRKGWQAF
jgi:hypothetical protein